jgi:hypothetical protein
VSVESLPEGSVAPEVVGPSTVVERDVDEAPLFSGPFMKELARRKKQERDAKIIITAEHGQTGLGKTALAVYLAKLADTSPGGFNAEKSTLSVPRFLQLWDELDPGSAAILDEAEQLDARRAMSNQNVDAAEKMQTRRVNQIITIMTLPSPREIDARVERLADFWINCECRGRARVYQKKIHRIKQSVYYQTLQTITWPNMDRDPDYKALSGKKRVYIDEEADDDYIRRSEHNEILEKERKKIRREVRDEWIKAAKEAGIPGSDIAAFPNVDLTAGRINQIARGE